MVPVGAEVAKQGFFSDFLSFICDDHACPVRLMSNGAVGAQDMGIKNLLNRRFLSEKQSGIHSCFLNMDVDQIDTPARWILVRV